MVRGDLGMSTGKIAAQYVYIYQTSYFASSVLMKFTDVLTRH